jgi:ATP-binding protein involved in chromosome partitioning
VIVTTPQAIALLDVKRGVAMFQEAGVPVLGVVENMSFHLCRKCGKRHEIFAHGGGERYARELGVPFLGALPLTRELREGGDSAAPIVAAHRDHPVTASFRAMAQELIGRLERDGAPPRG